MQKKRILLLSQTNKVSRWNFVGLSITKPQKFTEKLLWVSIILGFLALLVYGCAQKVPIEEVPQIEAEKPVEISKPVVEEVKEEKPKIIEDQKTEEPRQIVSQGEMDRMIQEMIEQRTKEITDRILGGGAPSTTQKEEFVCDLTPTPRKFSTNPYYTGPLIDSHIHMPSAFRIPSAFAQQVDWNPPVLDQDVSKAEIVCLFDKENIKYAFGFYIVTNLLTGQSVQAAKKFDQQYPGRIIPFILPPPLTDINLKTDKIEEILNTNKGLFKGYGEIAFYKGSFKGISPDDPTLLEIYKIADRYNLIVMIHPDNGQQQAIERILQDYPNVIFLFHGADNMRSYATDIVGKYPNAYFTIDGDLWDIPEDHQSVNLYAAETKEEFIADFKRDYNKVFNGAITQWKGPIEKYPDKFLWGTDIGMEWHYDTEVGALLEEIARSFIGQLNPEVQEKFAYKNAERMLKER